MNNNDKEKLKNIQIEILDYIVDTCKLNEIEYFLSAGTLLGSIRHDGYIPWDDDIDIALFRPDYNKLIGYLETNINQKYFMVNYNTDKEFNHFYTSIKKNNTFIKAVPFNPRAIHNGIGIDVFPMDSISKNHGFFLYLKAKIIKNVIHGILLFRHKENLKKLILDDGYRKLLQSSIKIIIIILTLPIPRKFLISVFEYISARWNSVDKYSINWTSPYNYKNEIIPVDKILPLKKAKFEKSTYNVPIDSDFVLTRLYGDYMTPPPLKSQIGHSISDIDFDSSKT